MREKIAHAFARLTLGEVITGHEDGEIFHGAANPHRSMYFSETS